MSWNTNRVANGGQYKHLLSFASGVWESVSLFARFERKFWGDNT